MVGVRGFEPPTFASRTQRSNQAEPHPEWIAAFRAFLARTCGMLINIALLLFFSSSILSFFQILLIILAFQRLLVLLLLLSATKLQPFSDCLRLHLQ